MATLTTGDFNTLAVPLLKKKFLSILRADLQFAKFGQEEIQGKHMGTTCRWFRPVDIAPKTTPLTEGVTPNDSEFTIGNIEATLAQYGDYSIISDWTEDTRIKSIIEVGMGLMQREAVDLIDRLIRDELYGSTNIRYAGSTVDTPVTTAAAVQTARNKLTSQELRNVHKQFSGDNVPVMMDTLYAGIIHPFCEFDLQGESTANSFVQLAAETKNDFLMKGMIGHAYGVMLYRSTNILPGENAGSDDQVYRNVFLGKEAFGKSMLTGNRVDFITKMVGSSGTEDPLNQRSTVGFKLNYVAKRLQDERILVLHAQSDAVV